MTFSRADAEYRNRGWQLWETSVLPLCEQNSIISVQFRLLSSTYCYRYMYTETLWVVFFIQQNMIFLCVQLFSFVFHKASFNPINSPALLLDSTHWTQFITRQREHSPSYRFVPANTRNQNMLRKLLQHFDPAIRELKDLVKVCEEKAVDEDIKRRVEKALELATVGTCNLWCLYSLWCVTTVCMDYRSYGYNTLYDALDKSMLNDNEDVSWFNLLLTQLHAVNCHIVWVFLKMEYRSNFKNT